MFELAKVPYRMMQHSITMMMHCAMFLLKKLAARQLCLSQDRKLKRTKRKSIGTEDPISKRQCGP